MAVGLTVHEAARVLGVTAETVRRQVRERKLPAVRASGGSRATYLIPRDAVELVKAHRDASGDRDAPGGIAAELRAIRELLERLVEAHSAA